MSYLLRQHESGTRERLVELAEVEVAAAIAIEEHERVANRLQVLVHGHELVESFEVPNDRRRTYGERGALSTERTSSTGSGLVRTDLAAVVHVEGRHEALDQVDREGMSTHRERSMQLVALQPCRTMT